MDENNKKNSKCRKFQNKGDLLDATAGNCCIWTNKAALIKFGVIEKGKETEICGHPEPVFNKKGRVKNHMFTSFRESCCVDEAEDSYGDCDSSVWPKGKFFRQVLEFAGNHDIWLDEFVKAWSLATTAGHMDLRFPDTDANAKKNWHACKSIKTNRKKWCKNDDLCTWRTVGFKRGKKVMGCTNKLTVEHIATLNADADEE